MKYAVDIPNFGYWAEPGRVAEFAAAVEEAGWDGLSVWDHILVWNGNDVADPWVLLTAAAMATHRITLMSMVTPLPRRRPWVLARQTVGVDRLSGGRLVLGVGIGHPPGPEFRTFNEPTDDRIRAAMLDEGLDILSGLWTGENFRFKGDHYRLENVVFRPTPVQQPRIPVWVAGMWPRRPPFRRAARWDGVAPIVFEEGEFRPLTANVLGEMLAYVGSHRETDAPFDVAVAGTGLCHSDEGREHAASLAAAGATWWREGWDPSGPVSAEDWHRGMLEGPPR